MERGRIAETRALIEDPTAGDLPRVEATLERLARAGRFRDEETAEHVERMSRTCALIAGSLGWDFDHCVELRAASAMHDIGKVGVPDSVLKKPGSLTADERKLIELHPAIGNEILAGSGDSVMELAATIALTHHEWVDGEGYPGGLAGDDIPLEGRIAAVADVFDALTHDRVYRSAFSTDEALDMLHEGSGNQFDPAVIEAFESVLPDIEDVRRLYPDRATSDEAESSAADGPIRVLIVDDHDALARGLDLVLRREGLEIAGTAHSLDEAHGMLERRAVDVVLLDIHLGAESGLDLVPDAKERGVRCLAYTGFMDEASLASARAAGADGLASKIGPARELSLALKAVVAGETYFDQRFQSYDAPPRASSLTPKETEVVALLASGLTGAGIAKRLFLSPETVRTHIRNAMDRVGATTRVHLIAITGPHDVVPDRPPQ